MSVKGCAMSLFNLKLLKMATTPDKSTEISRCCPKQPGQRACSRHTGSVNGCPLGKPHETAPSVSNHPDIDRRRWRSGIHGTNTRLLRLLGNALRPKELRQGGMPSAPIGVQQLFRFGERKGSP